MATTRSTMGGVATRFGPRHQALALWVPLSILGAVAGELVAWQIRSLGVTSGTVAGQEGVRYLTIIASAGIAASVQWWVLRRGRIEADWWVPASVAAALASTIVVIPTVIHVFVPFRSVTTSSMTAILVSAAALAAAGALLGTAQGLALRSAVGRMAWEWIPATALGGALAGGATSALSAQFLTLAPLATVSLAAATASLLRAACQLPVLDRLQQVG